ncbi:SARP family transcriptional regulator [Roseobacter sp. HKCCD9010]|uniref:BTAD domain-containing putative transcriptional regulator n=1 Tax=unclassified Roseobacter TaxID=196798 RepID=UPI001491EA1B|nr:MULTISPECIES: BTAD domain-containing putative transcriptional regulator [unclassified Roseobacter]MBF9052187.1 SARP family transcriptional regulator [Rhodobacterales bacterium HKCCD4356]NNV14142.1 SARP family transcriptional regulator [Roseobacter sp. HKCCD7357]NNV18366.1 SARP family transcriptional regulator [Roseobacter sp. HKCCD8768]NNV27806.1 SARP family transcriptional regulator [Roseobacter sp. HKCCD8192]NNV32090.1 SARP family transcriptional regulator [Roseobacter sp. HKCCD9061]
MNLSLQFLQSASEMRLRKARALLFFLLQPPNWTHRTELIVDILWRQPDMQKANASFRQTVRHVRGALSAIPEAEVETGSGTIQLAVPEGWALETEIAGGLADAETLEAMADVLRGYLQHMDLLLGLSDAFDSWVEVTRTQLIAAAQAALAGHFATPQTETAARAAELAITLEPHAEAAVRCLMRHHWANGAPTRAIETYNRLYRSLDEAFDAEPEAATVEILAAIKLNPDGGAQAAIPAAARKIRLRVVAVSDPSHTQAPGLDSLQTVLLSDLRNRLQSFREWQVAEEDAEEGSGEALTIALTLQPSGTTYRLAVALRAPDEAAPARLIEIEDPHVGWLDKVRGLTVEIANALKLVAADRHRQDLASDLYDRWLGALAQIGTWDKAEEERAIATLRTITAEAPDFAPAHAELAGIYNVRHVVWPGLRLSEEIKATALSHALKAISLDQLDTRAHRVLAWCYCHSGAFDLAEFHFDQSLTLNPQNPHSLASAALGFAFCDNPDRTRDQIDVVTRLLPAMQPFHIVYLAASNYLIGEFQTAASQSAEGAELMSTAGGWQSAALAKLGHLDEARACFEGYCEKMAARWCGRDPATPHRVLDWFVTCFPLRHETVRVDLRGTLSQLLPEAAEPGASVAHIGDVDADGAVEGRDRIP